VTRAGWIGIDEVGRGAWAGPIVVAAAWGPPGPAREILARGAFVADSKALSATARARCREALEARGIETSLGVASAREVDSVGLQRALGRAAGRALAQAPSRPVHLDGRTSYLSMSNREVLLLVGGDRSDPLIAAASIAAKLARDAIMVALDEELPWWGFARHKGYGTRAHRMALWAFGPSIEHRMSVRPVGLLVGSGRGTTSVEIAGSR